MKKLLVLALFSLLLSPPLVAQNDRQAGLFAEARQLPLVSQSVLVRIAGGEAALELTQVFANDGEELAQADFRLHLPRGAVVSAFGFWRDGRFLTAELKEKAEAKRAHAAAAAKGRATGLLEREGTMHSFSVFPIAAGALQQVETTIRLPVATERGRSHLRLPIDAFLGHAKLTSSAVIHLETDEPLRAFGADGVSLTTLDREERWARLALTGEEGVDIWWAEETPPLLTRAEAVPLDDGSFAVQVRLVLNDAGAWSSSYREVVLLIDTSFSMRRRSQALADLLGRVLELSPSPVRILSVAETAVEIEGENRAELLRRLLDGAAGFRASWEDLVRIAAEQGCDSPEVRCVVVTDPQVDALAPPDAASPETLFLADADELSYFGAVLGEGVLAYQPGVEPRGELFALVDETILPVMEVAALEQRGGTFEVVGAPRRRVAEGGMLRLYAASRSTEDLELLLAIGGRELARSVRTEPVTVKSRQGKAIRRGFYQSQLNDWMASYGRHRDVELRQQIIDVSLREGIPTALTSLHVSAPDTLPRTATVAPLIQRLGWLLFALGTAVLWLSRYRG